MSKQKTYFIKTYGCQMNQADSEKIAAVLEEQGYQLAGSPDEADLVVINSCSVRESAENRVFGLVHKLGLRDKKPRTILTGCMVGSATGDRRRYGLSQLKRKLPEIDYFLPNRADQPQQLVTMLRGILAEVGGDSATLRRVVDRSSCHSSLTRPPLTGEATTGSPALVPIMKGCDHFCSYCVVPFARGAEVSRPFDEIICEVEQRAQRGWKEVVLLGQNVNSYKSSKYEVQGEKLQFKVQSLRKRFKTPFAVLLAVLHEIPGIEKISFLTSNPWDLTDDIIEAMSLPKVVRYLHLPVQSGDDKILKKMNRPYTASEYIALVERIRAKIPDIQIGTDLIVGFPGETREQFENTAKLCRQVGFVKAYIARYSPRPGTAAFQLRDDVSPEEKKRRWWVLERLING